MKRTYEQALHAVQTGGSSSSATTTVAADDLDGLRALARQLAAALRHAYDDDLGGGPWLKAAVRIEIERALAAAQAAGIEETP